jgi:hypothetical protein
VHVVEVWEACCGLRAVRCDVSENLLSLLCTHVSRCGTGLEVQAHDVQLIVAASTPERHAEQDLVAWLACCVFEDLTCTQCTRLSADMAPIDIWTLHNIWRVQGDM